MCVCLPGKGLPGTAFGQFWLVLPDWKRFFPKGSPLVTIAASQGSTANWEDTLYGQAVLCPFQAQCARTFRPRSRGRRGTDGSLVTMRTLSTQLTSVRQQAENQATGSGRSIGYAERWKAPLTQKACVYALVFSCSQRRHWFVPDSLRERPVTCS